MRELILASTSPIRRQMLEDAGIPHRAVASGVDETPPAGMTDAVDLVTWLALQKASAVAHEHPDSWVLGADQLAHPIEASDSFFGKPRDPADHLARLQSMRGRQHVLVTGFALLGPEGQRDVGCHRTVMHVRADLSDEELRAYVDTGEGSGCAAGYAAEGRGAFLFERIEGDFFNVLGLPLLEVITVLRERGLIGGGRVG